MTIGQMMFLKAKNDNEKKFWQNQNLNVLKNDAAKGNPDAQYKLGKFYYNKSNFKEAEKWWESAARNPTTVSEMKERVVKRLNAKVFSDMYNVVTRVSYATAVGRRAGYVACNVLREGGRW